MAKLGYSSLTLTDLTEALPAFLILESSTDNIQKKNGNVYVPDFTKDGVVITPSFFIGSDKQTVPLDKFYYIVNNKEYHYGQENNNEIVVNQYGELRININIPKSYEVKAYINNYQNKNEGYLINISSRNSIPILVLEDGNSYTAVISSNREHFNEDNSENIILTASLYRGADELENVSYKWDGLTDDEENNNIDGEEKSFSLSRKQVNGTEVIHCKMTDNSNGLTFDAIKTIRDFVDEYRADLLPSSSLILTPNNPSVELTARVWHKTGIINNDENQDRFNYEWQLISSNGEVSSLENEKDNILIIDTNVDFPKENFTITCTITIDGKTTTSAYQNITYSPIEYTINVEPKQAWLNVDSEGNYSGTHTFNFKFQLLDKEKKIIPKEESDGVIISLDDHWSITSENNDYWDYILTLTLEAEKDLLDDSNIFEFQYKYLGKDSFSEEVYVIKNYAGTDGTPGTNGVSYTIDLSNSFHTFAGEQSHAIPDQETSFKIQAFYGDQTLEIKNVSWTNIEGLTINYNSTNQIVTIKTNSGNDGFLTKSGSIPFTIEVMKGESLTFVKVFNYTINYNSKTYYLNFGDNNTITYFPSTQSYNPSSISVKAFSRGINGEAVIYTDGIIYYSFNGENWFKLINDRISNYSNINNIYVRLYSPEMKSDILSENDAFLLDSETIPVLTSLEGVEIGGDNLIQWTKNMPIENGKWIKDGMAQLSQSLDGDFNCLNFEQTDNVTILGFESPRQKIDSEFFNKTFCLSFYIKSSDRKFITEANAGFAVQMRLYNELFQSNRSYYLQIGEIDRNKPFILEESLSNDRWVKAYRTFEWKDFISQGEQEILATECKYFNLRFYTDGARKISIKKVKLENGNTPSAWSASPYDIDFSDINGVNLISGLLSYSLVLNQENKKIISTDLLDPSFPYVLSWEKNLNGGNSFSWAAEYFKDEEEGATEILDYQNFYSSKNNYYFFFEPNKFEHPWVLSFYFGEISEELNPSYNSSSTSVNFSRIKLEKGTVKTPFMLTAEQQAEINNQINDRYVQIGNQYVELNNSYNSLQEQMNQTSVNINSLQGTISANSTSISVNTNSITKFEKSIVINSGPETTEPSIIIKTESQNLENKQSFFLKLTPAELSFINQNNNEEKILASMTQDTLTINKSQLKESYVSDEFNIGGLSFKITDSGVGVIWDIPLGGRV